MTGSTFGIPQATMPRFPAVTSGQTGIVPDQMAALASLPVANLRELSFPDQADPSDVFTLKTTGGAGYLDQGRGAMLAWADAPMLARVSDVIAMLHTGRGAAWIGLVLGLMALSVPALAASGVLIWLKTWRQRPRIRGNAVPGGAETVILVGSESGSTWGFAGTLHRALSEAGQTVRVAPMATFDPARYRRVRRILILTATYGEGVAPASARGFLGRLAAAPALSGVPVAVLGFGDRSFPAFCAYAGEVSRSLAARGWVELLPLDMVDRQSPQDFARWGHELGKVLGLPLELAHQPITPATADLLVLSRRDYGAEVQASTVILRFALRRQPVAAIDQTGISAPVGRLLAVVPAVSPIAALFWPRSRDGSSRSWCATTGGLCSGQLASLKPGSRIRASCAPIWLCLGQAARGGF